jgi:ethanolamine utilization protein EutM
MSSIGMIETYGLITAVEAADAALKSADIKLADLQFVKGGLVTVIFTGDVAAVKASVDAGEAAGNRVGKVLSTHVIARPDQGTNTLYGKKECGEVESDNSNTKPSSVKTVKKTVGRRRKKTD